MAGPDTPPQPVLEVGRVVKPHGLNGETVVDLVSNRVERLAPGSVLDSDAGALVVTRSRPFQGRWLVFFDGVHDRPSADALRGVVLRAEPMDDDPEALWVHELVGAEMSRASDGVSVGRVVSVVSNPASDLLELDDGHLVPVRFVVAHEKGRVVVDAPDGLFD